MKKISIRASVAAVSLTLALTPLGFAQSPAGTQGPVKTQSNTNTQPLPGAKVAAQELVVGGQLTPLGIAALAAAGIAVAIVYANANARDNDDALNAFIASQATATATR